MTSPKILLYYNKGFRLQEINQRNQTLSRGFCLQTPPPFHLETDHPFFTSLQFCLAPLPIENVGARPWVFTFTSAHRMPPPNTNGLPTE